MKTQSRLLIIILAAIALIVKMGYLFWALDHPASVGHLSVDALYHYKWASLIASGEVLTNAPYFRAPLYPFMLALLLKISGGSLIFIRVIQLLAGCLTLLVTYRIALTVAGRKAAIIAFLLLLLYPVTTYFEGELLLDSIFTLFALLSLYFFICNEDGRESPLWAGLFFALAALTRPTILIFFPIVIFYYMRHWRMPAIRKADIKRLALFAIFTVVLIAPVTVANYIASDQFILVSYQGGVNFHIGNNSTADGLSSTLPKAGKDWDLEDADYLAYKESGQKLQYGQQSAFWYKKGLTWIFNNPGQAIELFARKFYYFFSGHEISNNRPLDQVVFQNRLLSFLPIRFSWIISLAVLPLFFIRDNRKMLYTLYGLILIYGLVVAAFFVSSRFRLPVVPIIAVLAGWGLVAFWETIRKKQIDTRLFFAIVGAVGVFILTSSTIFPISLINPEQSLFLRGNQSFRQGDFSAAIARFDSLAKKQPDYKNVHLNLGITYLKLGDIDRAAFGFRQEMKYNPNSAEAANNLGVIFLLRQEYDSARYYCRRALQIKPYYTEAAINFLRTARRESDPKALARIEDFRQDIRWANQDKPAYIFEEGLYFTDRKRLHEAIDNHLRIVEIISHHQPSVSFEFAYNDAVNPDNKYLKLAYYQLGYLYGLSGEIEPSIRFSRNAIELDPELKEAYINLISGYRTLGHIRLADSVAAAYLSRWPEP